jgi:hypothetical protein
MAVRRDTAPDPYPGAQEFVPERADLEGPRAAARGALLEWPADNGELPTNAVDVVDDLRVAAQVLA